MDTKTLDKLTEKFESVVDAVFEKKMKDAFGPMVAAHTKKIVEQMRMDRAMFGVDRSGLSDEQKIDFAETVKKIAFGKIKANELLEEQDNVGGYLVPVEVANAIARIAASVGLVLNQAKIWPMTSDELDIPAYRGAFLEGEYLGVNAAGTNTGITFNQAKLIAKKWQLAFVVGNDLLADANVNLADWLLALGAEALANRVDKEGFKGTGAPFVGVLEDGNVTVTTMGAGDTTYAKVDPDDLSNLIAQVEESILDGAGFYCHRTVFHSIRTLKDTAGNYIVTQPNLAVIEDAPKGGGLKPAGYIWGYPAYTSRHFPGNADATQTSTKFLFFGNLQALAYGDKGELRVAQFQSGSFGGKEIAMADQQALVYKHRHAVVITLPAAFSLLKTAAS